MLAACRSLLRGRLATSPATRAYTSSGYGDPEQTGYSAALGKKSRKADKLEHPGREPVDEGKGTGGYVETRQPRGGGGGATLKPKISATSKPGGKGDREVEGHNQGLAEKRDYRLGPETDDAIGMEFWKGSQ